ncbi:hypothetical protein [Spirosoma endbachense]|uniref:Uncharacterized protein n=1 Tax=Spirosoma endbachense TaxID=2666025 RepID=A0A6P1VYP5_9BACT|nr:hypothetical protein [Spirosoma endbachense]QHV98273.1 hypothetical protein GJR95_26180 [Spirosoma endbachense]
MQQFFLVDFQKVSTVQEYTALKRAYVKKYPDYLKDEMGFREADIQKEEKHPELVSLNTPNFRPSVKK